MAGIAPFIASSQPDGLEKVAENMNLADTAVSSNKIFSDYRINFISNNYFASVFAGITGVIICLTMVFGFKQIFIRIKNR